MSKELDALEVAKKEHLSLCLSILSGNPNGLKEAINNLYKPIETALKEKEQFEKLIGMDLITFLKLLQYNSIYNLEYKRFENKKRVVFELDSEHKPAFYVEGIVSRWYFKDYNKTWALTKSEEQELEDLLNKKDVEDAHREEMWEARRDLEDR